MRIRQFTVSILNPMKVFITAKESIMKTASTILTLAALLVSVNVQAACRAAEAAKLGSDAGLARDGAAAVQMAEQERSNSDILGKCITGVTSIQVVPTFPSLMDIFNQAATRMCRLANNSIPRLQVSIPSVRISTSDVEIAPPLAQPIRASDFWSRIWR
jgi:hypothetical protein